MLHPPFVNAKVRRMHKLAPASRAGLQTDSNNARREEHGDTREPDTLGSYPPLGLAMCEQKARKAKKTKKRKMEKKRKLQKQQKTTDRWRSLRCGRVEWQFWTSSNDGCGRACERQGQFKREFQDTAVSFEQVPARLVSTCLMHGRAACCG